MYLIMFIVKMWSQTCKQSFSHTNRLFLVGDWPFVLDVFGAHATLFARIQCDSIKVKKLPETKFWFPRECMPIPKNRHSSFDRAEDGLVFYTLAVSNHYVAWVGFSQTLDVQAYGSDTIVTLRRESV